MTVPSTSQAARYTAIVFAGATSLTLTVAAGAYVISQMVPAASTTSPGAVLALPDRAVADGTAGTAPVPTTTAPEASPAPPSFTVGGANGRVLTAFAGPAADQATSDQATPDQATPDFPAPELPAADPTTDPGLAHTPAPRTDHGGQYDLGGAAVWSQRDEQRTTLTLTVDPEVGAVVHNFFGDAPATSAEPTRLSTEIDRERGGFAVAFSDPVLGERTVEMPGTTQPEQSTAMPTQL